ncbi:TPR domain protein in aerotolerance operon [Photobacterium aphoticum]|uniref:TPR domain protein in aerotolerance operon n=1 Tax=Photobacterium aphoticum TaxID=754436 RepID=A0A090R4Y6_9GAMM|nr:TPR domain protein in aerotolerance operon [Photobacterium aphoticum]
MRYCRSPYSYLGYDGVNTNKAYRPPFGGKTGFQHSQKTQRFLPGLSVLWLCMVIALAGPSWQKTTLPAYSLSNARVLVMDMSRSMYATDVTPNRLTQARFKAMDMLPGWKEGSTGLVAYAADGYTISPLTEDSKTLANLIPSLSPEIMPFQGSNAAAGIQEAIHLLKQAGHLKGDIILITDGLNDEELAKSQAELANAEYRVSILAVGTPQARQFVCLKATCSPIRKVTRWSTNWISTTCCR